MQSKMEKAQDIVFDHIWKSFDKKEVLQDISFTIPAGSRAVFIGPSGAGKSTILRLIASLIEPDLGEISGKDQRIGFCFDANLLYPKLTCLQNIILGIPQTRKNRKQSLQKALHWASVFQCESFLNQKCETLSAGQRQRCALARTFMKDPQIVLLDESFNALDPQLKNELTGRIYLLQESVYPFTLISVTHDLSEAAAGAGQIFVLDHGRIIEQGSSAGIYEKPATAFTAAGFGWMAMNLFPARWTGNTNAKNAGIFPFDISLAEPEEESLCFAAKFLQKEDFSFGSYQTYQIEDCIVRVLCPQKEPADLLYFPLDKISLFNEEGMLMEEKQERKETLLE